MMGWRWHKSHHEPTEGVFEKNDLYVVVFSMVVGMFAVGDLYWKPLMAIASGITLYGVVDSLFHDGMVHPRWPIRWQPKSGYLKRLVQAHRMHHAVRTREGAVSFAKSFATAAKPFDPATRRSALMLYAWWRHCDDVIDDQQLGFRAQETTGESSETRLNELRHLTRRAYTGEPMQSPAFAAFQEVALGHGIPERYPLTHLDGFAMDVAQRRYVTLDDTLDYCYHVAGVVGIMMAWIMGAKVWRNPTMTPPVVD